MIGIIDGYTGEENIFADIIGEYNAALFGDGDYVLKVGESLGYSIVSNNEIDIKDGVFVVQGRRGHIKKGTTEICRIENGSQALKRNDLIVIEYSVEGSTMVESFKVKVVKGTAGESAVDPETVSGDIRNGAVLHQMPIYRVRIEGINIAAVEQVFEFGAVAGLKECFQSVSDGKALVASAITDKRVPTDAAATFAQMAENIGKIVLGSGNALPEDVKKGKTFTNDDGVEYTGTYDFAKETNATATAEQITVGFTAWVNGELITGTRATPVKSLSGTVQVDVYRTESGSVRINFPQEFDSIPSISVSKGSEWGAASGGSSDNIKFGGVSAVTTSGFTLLYYGSENSGANGDYRYCYFNWTATAK